MNPFKPTLMIICWLLLACQATATQLKSQPMFGVMGQPDGSGVVVQRVLPRSTAAQMGIEANDVILSYNQEPVSTFAELVSLIAADQVGDDIHIEIRRDGHQKTLTGILLRRPREHHENHQVLYDEVQSGDNRLRSIVYKPADLKPGESRPALYFIQGYTCQSIDYGMVPQATMQQLFNQVVDSGFVVYKLEKFGVGDSAGALDCSQVNFTQELSGFKAGLKALKAYDFVTADEVFLFGHSLGGVYAPLIGEGQQFKGIAVYGAVLKSWYDYLQDMFTVQAVMMGTAEDTAQANGQLIQPLLQAWLNTNSDWQDIRSDPRFQEAFAANLLPHQGDQVFQRHYGFFRDLNAYDLSVAWRKVASPVLVMHGAFDIQTISDDWARNLTELLNTEEDDQATLRIFDNTDHGLMTYPTFQALRQAMNEGSYNPGQPGEHYNHEVATALISWMEDVLEP
ncbi:alpha/beta fold hydrolase [Marinicella sediminis]|uniref:Alpha/beta fold hydrolase n=1 Tax=Marinicella sediminis TaxID=1792834 RepID=A0ABV7JF54_9GAMM|nr:alpha/beta fold hydrolase [Marinicella sediminis]